MSKGKYLSVPLSIVCVSLSSRYKLEWKTNTSEATNGGYNTDVAMC